MREAGFRDVEIKRVTHSVKVSDAETYWRTTTSASAPLALVKQRLGPEAWERQSELALAYLRAELPTPRELATTAHLGIGTR